MTQIQFYMLPCYQSWQECMYTRRETNQVKMVKNLEYIYTKIIPYLILLFVPRKIF